LNDGEEGLFSSPNMLSVVTDSMQNTSARESERYSPSEEVLYILWDLKFHYHFTKPCHIHKRKAKSGFCVF